MIEKFRSISWIGLGLICIFCLNMMLVITAFIADNQWLDLLAILVSAIHIFWYSKLNHKK